MAGVVMEHVNVDALAIVAGVVMEHVNVDALAIVADMERILTGAQNGQCTLSTLFHHTVGIVPLYGIRCSLHVR